jgi:hypothetical protein
MKEDILARPKLIDKLSALQTSREGEENACFNLVRNVSKQRAFLHELISVNKHTSWTSQIISSYIVSLVSCWETFFRDVFVFLLKRNQTFSDALKKSKTVGKVLGHLPKGIVDQEEYIAHIFNFQNLHDIEDAFSLILGPNSGLRPPAEQDTLCFVSNKGWAQFSLSKLFPDWASDLDFILQERHRIIHDANYLSVVSNKYIQRIETELFFYLQLFGIFVSNNYQLPWVKLNTDIMAMQLVTSTAENCKAIVLTLDDLLSNDWEVME